MRQTVAKGMRRDIRRAMGPTAIQTLDNHAGALRSLQHDLLALAADHAKLKQDTTAGLARQFERMDTERDTTDKAVKMAYQDHAAFTMRGFRARFSWLFLGE